jgi:hypothetical protein
MGVYNRLLAITGKLREAAVLVHCTGIATGWGRRPVVSTYNEKVRFSPKYQTADRSNVDGNQRDVKPHT